MTPYLVSPRTGHSEHLSFAMATRAFVALRDRLTDMTCEVLDHAAAEQLIFGRGTEVLRLLFEGCLNQRAQAEPVREVVGSDGTVRTHHRAAKREVESVFGTVVLDRDRVGARGVDGLAPVDAVLNLAADRFTFGVRQRVAEEAARGSFDAAAAVVRSTSGTSVAKRQAEELTCAAAQDFTSFYTEGLRVDEPVDLTHVLVLTADGKGVVMRPDALREATQKAAAKARHKLKKRLSKGEKTNRKRMATVAAVYTVEAVPRTQGDVLGELDRTNVKPRPRAKQKRVFASLKKPPGEVITEMFDEATRRDPEHRMRWVALVDGNKTQIMEIQAAAARYGVRVTLVLDLIHVTEYLWSAAWEFHTEGDPAAQKWVTKYLKMILSGRASDVAGAIRRSATTRAIEKRTNVDKAAGYFTSKKALMHYDAYLRDGLPIASGVIEGACRHLVKDRMDITGARWGLDGAEAVLQLRSMRASGDLDCYWAFHRAREFERNHRSRYAESEAAWLRRSAA